MKRIYLLIGVVLINLTFLACSSSNSKQEYIAEQINITMPDVLNIEYTDEHKGVHGDGQTFGKVEFDETNGKNFVLNIENNQIWNKLPLTENLNLLMYGGEKNNIVYEDEFAQKLGITHMENGYWFFIDRHTQSDCDNKDTDLLDRCSFNFTLAMYNADINTLYYFEFDT